MSYTANRLLARLPSPLCELILEASRVVDLPVRTSLSTAGEVPTFAYLLTRGVASVVVVMAEGGSSEVGMIGKEGLVNVSALLGPAASQSDIFMQVGGSGLRVPMKVVQRLFEESAEFRLPILQYVQAQLTVIAQVSACNRLHEAEARLARWLLTASYLSQSDTMGLTQEFMAQMLGSQRTTVALVAGSLQRSGFIDYSRGTVRILDATGLATVACDCYRVTQKALADLYV
ncbi:MAG: Crp/Fnr family transcriptional regulator [Janthinobacterium lividum]